MSPAEQRFRELHAATYEDLSRFVRRRVPPSDAEDVVSTVFTIAWRRLADVPADDARPWLFGVARNVLANQSRWRLRHGVVDVRMVVAAGARHWRPGADERLAAAAFVDRLVAEPAKPSRRLPAKRVLAGCAAAVLVGAGAAVVPSLLPGGGETGAYAAWATPRRASDTEAVAMATDCAGKWGPGWGREPVAADIVLAEKRGDGMLLLVAKGGGEDVVNCLALNRKDGVTGADLFAAPAGQPGPARVTVRSQDATGEAGQGWISTLIGRATGDVTGVDVLVSDDATVHASVRAGWWVAWWPGREAGEADGVRIAVHTGKDTETYTPSQLTPGER